MNLKLRLKKETPVETKARFRKGFVFDVNGEKASRVSLKRS